MKQRKGFLFFVWLTLLSLFLLFPEVFAKEGCALCEEYEALGFPKDYAERLCALSAEHPKWEFEPLFITALSRTIGEEYDFETVVEKETEIKERNLVFALEAFSDYWESDKIRYDSGFYPASSAAVAYFMDPRNFLGEKGIFQFLPLSGRNEESAEDVEKVLQKSALEKAPLAGKDSMAELLIELGEKWNVSAIPLAVRLRQEQGEKGNPLLWGRAGEAFGKTELNGYFNPFNISASGNSEEEIYASGALFAKKMGWDTLEKALAGGVEYLAEKYVLCHQNTLYLQKWNVDPRSVQNGKSRNFWGQYMQNIGGAKAEAEAIFAALEKADLLEEGFCFLIPVYEKMPAEPVPDPAEGACAAFALLPEKNARHAIPASLGAFSEEPQDSKLEKSAKSSREAKGKWDFLWCFPTIFLILGITKPRLLALGRKKPRGFW